jgi:SAM-dependent methyltransferase
MNDLRLAREAALPVVLAEGSAPPFSRSFDLVGLFDVVEHVEDDAGLLDQAAKLVAPDGYILLTVPADPRLWSSLDDYAGHLRRYTRKMVFDLIARAGLVPGVVVPIFRVLWPLGWLRTLFVGRRPITHPESEYRISALANLPLRALLALERALLGDSQRGVGTSWLASARLPESTRR